MPIRRDIQRLTKNGSSCCVNIRKPVLRSIGWTMGMPLIVEVQDDNTLVIRKPRIEDLDIQVNRPRQLPIPMAVGE